jgi:hypothetical protein
VFNAWFFFFGSIHGIWMTFTKNNCEWTTLHEWNKSIDDISLMNFKLF